MSRRSTDDLGLTPDEQQDFETQGYLLVSGALSMDMVERLNGVIDELMGDSPNELQNHSDIFRLDPVFLELVDLPQILPKVRELLGTNIWINHSHVNRNPPEQREERAVYGWHRDGGAIYDDLPSPAPMVVLKVGFYLTDLQEPDSGQTYVVPGSHRSDMVTPAVDEFAEAAVPVCSRPGDAIMYDFRLIHSVRSPNLSTNTRRAVFIQYAYRWISPMNRMEVAHLADECSPLRLQLLGLSTTSMNIGGIAEKRSSRFYPLGDDLALRDGIRSPGRLRRIVNRARRFFRS